MWKDGELQNVGDLISLTTIIVVMKDWLPHAAALLSVLWILIRLYEWFRFRVLGKKDRFD